MPVFPGVFNVDAVIDRDAVEPGSGFGRATELVEFAVGFQKHIVGGIFCS